MTVAQKKYVKAKSAEEALTLGKENEKSFRFVAGGTDVLVNKFQDNDEAECLIDISGIDELKQVIKNGKFLKIGALVKLNDLQKYPEIKNHFPSLIEAANSVASPLIRKTATIGGNILCENRCIFYNQSEWWRKAAGYCLKCDGDICIATGGSKLCYSKFVSDTAPVLIALDAYIEVLDNKGGYVSRLEDIYTGNGLQPRKLSKGCIIKFIHLPVTHKYFCSFKKLRVRKAVDFTSLTTAVSLSDMGKIRIVVGGVDPKPILVEGAISNKKEELIRQVLRKCRVVDNDFYNRAYRKEMISVFLLEQLEEIKRATKI